jgi:hypothetical protein
MSSEGNPPPASTPASPGPSSRPRPGVVIAVIVVIVVVLWLILRGGSDDGTNKAATTATTPAPPPVAGVPATLMDAPTLRKFAAAQTHPVYWVGPRSGRSYEATRTTDNSIYVRYLPKGAKAGDSRAAFLTIGSYANANPLQTVRDAVAKRGGTSITLPNGAQGVTLLAPSSVYMAFPGATSLVEVWDPDPARALALARKGAVVPIS